LAGLNKVKIFWVDASFGRSGLEEKFDLFEETRLTIGVEAWTSGFWYGCGGS
jgi:hypothetical protein